MQINNTTKYTCYPYLENCQHRGTEDRSKEYYTRKGRVYYYSICNNTCHLFNQPCRWGKVNDRWLVKRIKTPTRNGKCRTVGWLPKETIKDAKIGKDSDVLVENTAN